MTKSILKVQNLTKRYGKKSALKNISLEIPHHCICAVLGPNGAGKTTLFRTILDLLPLQSGRIHIAGISHRHHEARKNIVFVPDNFTFFPFYTVQGTLEFWAHMHELPKEKIQERVSWALSRLGIESLKKQKMNTLSKGQRQRVGLATLFLTNAQLVLMDEPFSGIDPVGIKELKDLLLDFKREGKTIILNSHILGEIEKVCDKVAIINHGKILDFRDLSEIESQGSLEDYFYSLVKEEQ